MSGETQDAHIAVVDDEPELRDMVQRYFVKHGLSVSAVDGGAALDELMAQRPVDLVILDINMPVEDGISIARRLRQKGDIGIIMLTANNDSIDKIVGLEVGADDYVTKPFDLREVLARVRGLLRRLKARGDAPATLGSEVQMGRCRLNLEQCALFDADGEDIPITAMEFDLLRTFAERPNRPLSRDQLLDLAHAQGDEVFDRAIDTRIARLRQKIEAEPSKPAVIKTVRGVGYMFVPGR